MTPRAEAEDGVGDGAGGAEGPEADGADEPVVLAWDRRAERRGLISTRPDVCEVTEPGELRKD